MKVLSRLVLSSLLAGLSSLSYSGAGIPGKILQSANPFSGGVSDIKQYLLNLGSYLGYDLKTDPANNDSFSPNLLNGTLVQQMQNYALNSFLGSFILATAGQDGDKFVPESIKPYSIINAFANYSLSTPPYSTASAQSVSVSPLIDQPPYQNDPVSQAILNIVGTPDYSYCLDNKGVTIQNCTYSKGTLNDAEIVNNAIGDNLVSTATYFTYKAVQPLLGQLNSNSLTGPLLYNTNPSSDAAANTSSSDNSESSSGLIAQSQAQQAANFIRFASSAIIPLQLPNRTTYDNLYVQALPTNTDKLSQLQARTTLANYLASLRVYAAQNSVGIANLYYIMSKRLPQAQTVPGNSDSTQQTSQALSEFNMATWRLNDPSAASSPDSQWMNKINKASSATVQKEMAVLLAEINYQLYLTRQQQERILLTNTMLLIQNARSSQPDNSLSSAGSSTSSTNGS